MSAYISPTAALIGPTGISAPTFAQILAYLQSQYYAIFGADAYLGNDSQDGQYLAVFAQGLSDANSACIATYNGFSPSTGQGVGLSSTVMINGLRRLVASFSNAQVTLSGIANITLQNLSCIDPSGNIWSLPQSVSFGGGGVAIVSAVCTTPGAIALAANALNINTPTYGLNSITNLAGNLGNPVETDATLRVRQSVSVALPSVTIFEGVIAAIEQIPGVGRVRGYENNTNNPMPVSQGGPIPARTVCFIVENGAAIAAQVFQAIFSKLTPGIPMYLDPGFPALQQSTIVTDSNGSTRPISFMTPLTAFPVPVNMNLTALSGFSLNVVGPVIAAAVRAYLGSVPIGGTVYYFGGVAAAIQGIGAQYTSTFDMTSVQIFNGSGFVAADVPLSYNSAAVNPVASGDVIINGVNF